MTRVAVRAVLFSTAILGLAACDEGLNLGGESDTGSNALAPTVNLGASGSATRDVERPDIFTTTDEALWDGRPSLGGIWVAHPDVTTPERAIVTNNTTNQRIAAALFRRERTSPGPTIQLSSDAAVALNILAGAPTEVTIIAVRPEEVEVEDPEPVISDEVVGEADGEAEAAAGTSGEPETENETAQEQPRRGNFLQRLFGRHNAAPPSAAAAASAAAASEIAAETAGTGAEAPGVETTTLDPVASGAAAAIAAADAEDKPAARPEREAAPSGLRNPFVQVGQYTVEANAFSARDNLRSAGIVPTVLEGSNDDGPFWRVIIGPVTTADDQAEILAQVKQLGFRDAFLTSR